jgi:hypothetical protein
MALGHYQQTSETNANALLLGGFRLGVAASAATFVASMGTILGIGNLTGFTENIELSTTQAGNSNMPTKKVVVQTLTLTFELLEFWPPTFATIRGGSLDTSVTGTASTYITGTPSANVFSTGGLNVLTGKAFRFENTAKSPAGATVQTVLIVYNAKLEQGLAFTPKSDHDTDPAMVIPFTLTAELETSRAAGDQLYKIETQLGKVS